jgi:hypothetical protein
MHACASGALRPADSRTRSTRTRPFLVSGLAVVPSMSSLPALNSTSSLEPAGRTGVAMG